MFSFPTQHREKPKKMEREENTKQLNKLQSQQNIKESDKTLIGRAIKYVLPIEAGPIINNHQAH